VRGYAMSESEVEETVSDPYMGFNIGATKIRQLWDGKIVRHFFESPLVRLMKDFEYRDIYHAGQVLAPGVAIGSKSIIIYRYYERASKDLGEGKREEVEDYARGLNDLIEALQERICGADKSAQKKFRVYLVAHSMGGLICRCFLQNPAIGNKDVKKLVDKVFTYATPHNGIDLQLFGNVSGIFSFNQSDTFNRARMKKYLKLKSSDDANTLTGDVSIDKFFCLVGTNDRDYEVGGGSVRRLVGPMSDGLVRIDNATVKSRPSAADDANSIQAPRAFVHRSHSGHYGIVNSEEGYQNLTRFLFGDVRVDGILEVKELALPPDVQKALDNKKTIRASYHFEAVVRVRGGLWELHRRTVQDKSAIFRTYDELCKEHRHPHLFSAFLMSKARINQERTSLGFCIDLGVLVPQYEVDHKLWFDDHYEGGYLFRDKVNLEAIPPANADASWTVNYGFDSRTPNQCAEVAQTAASDSHREFRIPIRQDSRPGIKADLVLRARPWNQA
jgi:pimeloyl-ACP methyl ester carboxylesterase